MTIEIGPVLQHFLATAMWLAFTAHVLRSICGGSK